MKFKIEIMTDDANELSEIVARLTGTTALSAASRGVDLDADLAGYKADAAPAFAAPAAASGAVEYDSTNMPWDSRIHAETKAKNKNGTWRYRRGVDDATVTAVEAELRATAPAIVEQPRTEPLPAAPAPMMSPQPSPEQVFGVQQPQPMTAAPAPMMPAPAFNPPPAAPEFSPPAFVQASQQAMQPQQPVAVAPQPAPPAPQQPVAAAPAPAAQPQQSTAAAPLPVLNFQQLMGYISTGLREKKIDNAYIQRVAQHYQLPNIPALANTHAHLIPNIVQELRNVGVL